MKWLDRAKLIASLQVELAKLGFPSKKSRYIRKWRLKEVHYLFTELDPENPLFLGIFFIESEQTFYHSQN